MEGPAPGWQQPHGSGCERWPGPVVLSPWPQFPHLSNGWADSWLRTSKWKGQGGRYLWTQGRVLWPITVTSTLMVLTQCPGLFNLAPSYSGLKASFFAGGLWVQERCTAVQIALRQLLRQTGFPETIWSPVSEISPFYRWENQGTAGLVTQLVWWEASLEVGQSSFWVHVPLCVVQLANCTTWCFLREWAPPWGRCVSSGWADFSWIIRGRREGI